MICVIYERPQLRVTKSVCEHVRVVALTQIHWCSGKLCQLVGAEEGVHTHVPLAVHIQTSGEVSKVYR